MNILILTNTSGDNHNLAQKYKDFARKKNINSDFLFLDKTHLPLFGNISELSQIQSEILKTSRQKFIKANALAIFLPEYNGNIPPTLTNLLCWLSVDTKNHWRSLFIGKKIQLGTVSGSFGHYFLISCRLQFAHMGCHVQPLVLIENAHQKINDNDLELAVKQILN